MAQLSVADAGQQQHIKQQCAHLEQELALDVCSAAAVPGQHGPGVSVKFSALHFVQCTLGPWTALSPWAAREVLPPVAQHRQEEVQGR